MNYKLTVGYNGRPFNGWQVQPNLITVQGELEKSLSSIFKAEIKTIASGRTDAGVSACGQVVNFENEHIISEYSLLSRVNLTLPPEIKVLKVEYESNEFNARFSAKRKTYAYNFYVSRISQPFLDNFCYRVPYLLNLELLEKELKSLIGTHNFTSLSSVDTKVENKIRTIYDISISKNGEVYTVSFTGSGFLKNMIRIIMGTAFDIARGKIHRNFLEIINDKDRKSAGKTAGAVGLVLVDVAY